MIRIESWKLGFIWLYAIVLAASVLGHIFPTGSSFARFGQWPEAPYFVAFFVLAALWLSVPRFPKWRMALYALSAASLCLAMWVSWFLSAAVGLALIYLFGITFPAARANEP